MTFVSFSFYIILMLTVAVYYVTPVKMRWVSLLAASLVFYWFICAQKSGSFLMLIVSAVICYICGRFLNKTGLAFAVILTLMPLFIVRLLPFALSRFSGTALFANAFVTGVADSIISTVGISFFTLQLLSYLIDLYKGKITPEKNFFRFLLFVSFFPQIIQGPIPRFSQLAPQLYEGHKFEEKSFVRGFILILWGFFLKFCIADKACVIVDSVFNNYTAYQGMYALVAGILYSLQLYADFLACTSFAQGFAKLFCIDVIDNFQRPYFSTSIKDFWRRWHISLSSWLRDYIYIPLGGNRKGTLRKYLNIIITFAVSGLWHGFGLNFLFWGILHGVYQIVGELLTPVKAFLSEKMLLNSHELFKRVISTIFTFILVMLAWIPFRADTLRSGLFMIKSIFTVRNPWILTDNSLFGLGLGWKECMILSLSLLALFFISLFKEKGTDIIGKIFSCNLFTRWCIYIGIILFVMVFGSYGFGFDSRAFIYGGF